LRYILVMEILPKLFGGPNRVKLIRLFLFNPDNIYLLKELHQKTKIKPGQLRKELLLLESIGLVKTKKIVNSTPTKKSKKTKKGKKKQSPRESIHNRLWGLNQDFFFTDHLQSLFSADFFVSRDELAKKFKNCGKIKLLILSGVFVQEGGRRVDILVVGDNLKKKLIEKTVVDIESEIGRELVYAIMNLADFAYRFYSSDKFLRDVLDYPHKKIIDKMNI